MSILNIPHELYSLVFSHLTHSDIYNCMLVCKYWYSPAVETYYHRVTLLPRNISYLKSNIFHQTSRQLEYGYLVKYLKLNPSQIILSVKEFEILLSYFPNLNILDILNSSNQTTYLQVLTQIGKTNLQQLQIIKTRVKDFSTFYQFCKRLTCLDIDNLDTIYTFNGISGNVISFLPDFACLQKLTIRNKIFPSEDKDIVLFQILNTCKNLETFNYSSNFIIAENEMEAYQKRLTRISSSNFSDNKHLKHINLHLNSFTKPFVQYFTECISSCQHLQKFSLNIKSDFSHWIHENGADVIMKFGSHLSKVNDTNISFGIIDNNIYDVQSKVSNYWMFIGAVKGNRSTFNRCNFLVSQDEKKRELLINVSGGKKLLFECGIWIPDYFITNVSSGVSSFCMPLPTTTLGPWILHELNIDTYENLKGVSIYLLKFVLTHCLQLKRFWIHNFQNNGIGLFAGGENMTEIRTKKMKLSYNLLEVIFKQLPNITKIIAIDSIFIKDDAFSKNITIDFTGFKQLQELCIDLQNINIKNFNQVFLQLIYTNYHHNNNIEYYKMNYIEGEQKYNLTATTINFIEKFEENSTTITIKLITELHRLTLEDNNQYIGTLPLNLMQQ